MTEGYAQVALLAAADPVLTGNAVRIYVLLVGRDQRRTGVVWPSYKTLEAETGLSESTIRRELRLLQDAGYIVIGRQGANLTNKYALLVRVRGGKVLRDRSPMTGPDWSPVTGEVEERKQKKKQKKEGSNRAEDPDAVGTLARGAAANVVPLRGAVAR